MLAIQILVIVLFVAPSTWGQTSTPSAPTCSNTNLQMTPAFRGQVLDYINDARDKLKNGQLLLENGEYALIPETMPELSWDCEIEEEMHELAKRTCKTRMFPTENYTWFMNMLDMPHDQIVYGGLHYVDLVGYYANYLSQHTIYTGGASMNYISALHDKAEKVGCAIFDCYMNNGNNQDDTGIEGPGVPATYLMNYFFCKITPDVQFGEKVYEVSSSANANFPSQDVICPTTYGMNIEIRQMILEKINAIRQKIQQGTYLLQNGNYALQAENLPNLIWDCDEEAQVHLEGPSYMCFTAPTSETMFQANIPINWSTYNPNGNTARDSISAYLDQLYTQNLNLNFLSQSTTYATPYAPALALSDQATVIACAYSLCFDSATNSQNFNFACRAKPFISINGQLYQV